MGSGQDEPVGLTQYGKADVEIEQIEKMLELDPFNEGLLDIAAFTYYSDENLEKALIAYQKLINIDSSNPVYHYCLGNTLYRLSRGEEAYEEWTLTISLDPKGRYGLRAKKRMEEFTSGQKRK